MTAVSGRQCAAEPEREFADWRARREADLADPHGWLSIVGLHWLTDVSQTVAGVPGRFGLAADGGAEFRGLGPAVVGARPSGDGVTGPVVDAVVEAVADGLSGSFVGAGAVTEVQAARPDIHGEHQGWTHRGEVAEGGSVTWLRYGEVLIELIRRTGRLAIRVRDPAAAARARFRGMPTFAPQDRWRVPAAFLRLSIPWRVSVGAVQPDLTHRYTVIGTVEFEVDRAPQQLLVFGRPDGGALILFHDRTNGVETAAWRSVTFRPPDVDGPVTLDFNRAANLPFVFSAFGTCPRPPEENVITARVTAGEKLPEIATVAA